MRTAIFCSSVFISCPMSYLVASFKGGADGKGLRDAVESVVDDLEKVLL